MAQPQPRDVQHLVTVGAGKIRIERASVQPDRSQWALRAKARAIALQRQRAADQPQAGAELPGREIQALQLRVALPVPAPGELVQFALEHGRKGFADSCIEPQQREIAVDVCIGGPGRLTRRLPIEMQITVEPQGLGGAYRAAGTHLDAMEVERAGVEADGFRVHRARGTHAAGIELDAVARDEPDLLGLDALGHDAHEGGQKMRLPWARWRCLGKNVDQ